MSKIPKSKKNFLPIIPSGGSFHIFPGALAQNEPGLEESTHGKNWQKAEEYGTNIRPYKQF